MNAAFDDQFHCAAAQPHATFLRISVSDDGDEVAYDSLVLGRLRRGYRIFKLRSLLGTRIELAYLLVRIVFEENVVNLWSTPREVRSVQRLTRGT